MVLADYIRLTSPGINLLVMFSGFMGMWVAARGTVSPSLALWCLLGIGLASAGASVFNNFYDRDIDRVMSRTSGRPLPAGRIEPRRALLWGIVLSVAAFMVLLVYVNAVSAFIAVFTIIVYSYFYTVLLKRHTPLATEIGGLSGALPPVIGWAAVRGDIGMEALLLFAILFLWQPPHFWSLASRYRNDYQKADIPTMSALRSQNTVYRRSLLYITALTGVSLVPCFAGLLGNLYMATSFVLGLLYLCLYLFALRSQRDMNGHLFFYSIFYLSTLFAAMLIDIQG